MHQKTLYFGDIKTAEAKEDGVVKYEVVYVEMKDTMINSKGECSSKFNKVERCYRSNLYART
jgi:hypothetical protein